MTSQTQNIFLFLLGECLIPKCPRMTSARVHLNAQKGHMSRSSCLSRLCRLKFWRRPKVFSFFGNRLDDNTRDNSLFDQSHQHWDSIMLEGRYRVNAWAAWHIPIAGVIRIMIGQGKD
jgi:hypothetical protein